jgi:glycosidase
MKERFRGASTDAPDRYDPQVILGVALLFSLQGIPCLYYGTEQGLHGRGDSDQDVREALWGKARAFDVQHPFYRSIRQLTAIRDSQPALRYGRLYFRPLSGDGAAFGLSPFAPGVLAFSRILNDREVVVVANASTESAFRGYVLVDFFLHQDGERLRILNEPNESVSEPVETRGGLNIQEPDGRITGGPARMVRVTVAPMSVQILGQ